MPRSKSNSRRQRCYQLVAVVLIALSTIPVGAVVTADAQSSTEYDHALVVLNPDPNDAWDPHDTYRVTLTGDTGESQEYVLDRDTDTYGSVDRYASLDISALERPVSVAGVKNLTGANVKFYTQIDIVQNEISLSESTTTADLTISASEPVDWGDYTIFVSTSNGHSFTLTPEGTSSSTTLLVNGSTTTGPFDETNRLGETVTVDVAYNCGEELIGCQSEVPLSGISVEPGTIIPMTSGQVTGPGVLTLLLIAAGGYLLLK